MGSTTNWRSASPTTSGEAGGDPHQNINDLFDDLDDDDADLLAAGLIYNQERLSRARTGPAYYSVSQQLVYRLGTPRPKGFADIKGKLAVASGSRARQHAKAAQTG